MPTLAFTPKCDRPLFELQSALDLEHFWRAAVHLLSSALSYHSCSLLVGIVNSVAAESRHRVVAGDYFNYKSAAQLSVAAPFLANHPKLKIYTYTQVVRDDPRAAQRRLQKEGVLSAWNQFVHLVFWNGNEPKALLSIRRTAEQGDFTPQEMKFLLELHPLIDGGLHRLRKIHAERGRSMVLERFLGNLPLPVIFLNQSFEPTFVTQEAYDQCAVWNHGFRKARALNSRDQFRVPKVIAAACARLESTGELTSGGMEGIQVVHPTTPQLSAHVAMSPAARAPWYHPVYIVTFFGNRDPAVEPVDGHPTAGAMNILQSLTPSERAVAHLVAEGCRNQDIALRLGKSLRTVEFQLNSIYRKLDISSRTQLVRLLV